MMKNETVHYVFEQTPADETESESGNGAPREKTCPHRRKCETEDQARIKISSRKLFSRSDWHKHPLLKNIIRKLHFDRNSRPRAARAGDVCEAENTRFSPRSSKRNTNPTTQAQMDGVVIIKHVPAPHKPIWSARRESEAATALSIPLRTKAGEISR